MMKHSTYTSYDELPLMLSVAEVAAVLGISRAGAYELARSSDYPALKIGSRIVVPKDKFLAWIDANSGSKKRTAVTKEESLTPQPQLAPQTKSQQQIFLSALRRSDYTPPRLAGAIQEPAGTTRARPRRLGTETRTARVSVPKALCFSPTFPRSMQRWQRMLF